MNEYGWNSSPCRRSTKPGDPYEIEAKWVQTWLEVDDQGRPRDPAQLDAIRRQIANAHRDRVPVLLAPYIHGWNGNADEDAWTNLGCSKARAGQVDEFYALMARVADTAQRMSDAGVISQRPRIIAVWVGWRGKDAAKGALLAEAESFRSRGHAADVIGDRRGVDESGVPSLRSGLDTLASDLDPQDRLLLWGLSFGGRMIAHLYMDRSGHLELGALGANSLVVTFNAAIGSDCFDEALREGPDPAGHNGPNWINISSSDDVARKVWYPVGSAILMAGYHCNNRSPHRNVAIGFVAEQITHEMSAIGMAETDLEPFPASFGPAAWTTDPDVLSGRQKIEHVCYNSYLGPAGYGPHAQCFDIGVRQRKPAGAMWLLTTDKTMFSMDGNESLNSLHSASYQTNLTRMILLALYDQRR